MTDHPLIVSPTTEAVGSIPVTYLEPTALVVGKTFLASLTIS